MADNIAAVREIAQRLVCAHNLACSAEAIMCMVDDRKGRTLTEEETLLLREWLPDLESAVNDVVVALVGHALAEVG